MVAWEGPPGLALVRSFARSSPSSESDTSVIRVEQIISSAINILKREKNLLRKFHWFGSSFDFGEGWDRRQPCRHPSQGGRRW